MLYCYRLSLDSHFVVVLQSITKWLDCWHAGLYGRTSTRAPYGNISQVKDHLTSVSLRAFIFLIILLLLLIIIISINIIIIINNIMIMITISIIVGEFTEEDGRKKRATKRSCVTNVTGLLLSDYLRGFSWSSLNIFLRICLIESEDWQRVISNKVIVTLYTQRLPSCFLSRPLA